MKKNHLIAPGPTQVSPAALAALAQPAIHHRGPTFKKIYKRVRNGLKWIFQTKGEVLSLTCSGTGAFEAVFTNFTCQKDTVICIGGGKFSDRWSEMAMAFELNVINVDVEWGEGVNLSKLSQALEENENVSMVTMCASETSSGVYQPVQEVAKLVNEKENTLLALDGITAVGVHNIPMDEWGIDIVISGSQKAFSLPPGLAFIAASSEAWKRIERSDHRRYYFDLRKEYKKVFEDQTAFTPASATIVALDVVLEEMQVEGRENIFIRHALLSKATIAGGKALGCTLFPSHASHSVTALRVPEGILAPEAIKIMREKDGVVVAGGQEHLKPFLIRIGHMGYADFADVLVALASLENALNDLGYQVMAGAGVAAAQKVFRESRA